MNVVFVLTDVSQLKENYPDRVIVLGIAGPTGSGKTALAERIGAILNALIVDVSCFVKIEDVIDQNYEDPTVVDFVTIQETLSQLKSGKKTEIDLPQLDFEKKARLPPKCVAVPESRVVILEVRGCLSAFRVVSLSFRRCAVAGAIRGRTLTLPHSGSLCTEQRHFAPARRDDCH